MIKIVERRAIDEVGRLLQREFDLGMSRKRSLATLIPALKCFNISRYR